MMGYVNGVKTDIHKDKPGFRKCAKYVPVFEQTVKENNIPFHAIHIDSREEAQNAPTPVTNYALFRDGGYITNEQMNDKSF